MLSSSRRLAGIVSTALVAAATTVVVGAATAPADAAAATCDSYGSCTQYFGPTGATGSFTVPAGVTRILAVVQGAQGRSSSEAAGGKGGRVDGAFDVEPGSVLYYRVGSSTNGDAGSYVFGSQSGTGQVTIVAGGGGDAQGSNAGGAGGGAAGEAAGAGHGAAGGAMGGRPGTSTTGGTSSQGAGAGMGPATISEGVIAPGMGGRPVGPAGAGGDGWYGGGGGGYSNFGRDSYSAGGGGSGYASSQVEVSNNEAGARVSDGVVQFLWSASTEPVGPSVSTSTLPDGVYDASYSQTLTASGGTAPYTWSVSAGSPPAGLTLSPGGVLSGKPSAATATPASFTVQVTDADAKTSTKDLTLTVARATQSVAFTNTPPSEPKVGTTFNATTTSTGSTSPVTLAATGGGCTISGTTVTFTHTTSCTVTATKPATDNYTVASASFNPETAKGDQSVYFTTTPLNNPAVGGTYNPVATGRRSGNAVTITIDNTSASVCTLNSSGTQVTFNAAGTCALTATQPGNDDYNAGQATQTINVGKAAQTITFTSGVESASIGGTYRPNATGGKSGNDITYAIAEGSRSVCSIRTLTSRSDGTATRADGIQVSFNHAGTCTITADQAGNNDYSAAPQATQSITVAPNAQTVDITSTAPANAAVGSATYTVNTDTHGSDNPVTIAIDPSTTNNACTVTGTTVSFTNAGTCALIARQAASDDYAAATSAVQSFTVAPAPLPAPATATTSTTPAAPVAPVQSAGVGDSTRASITATITSTRTISSYGWYRKPVTVTFSCAAPATAPLASPCPAPVTIKRNSTAKTITRSITTTTGAVTTLTVTPINLDKTKPRVKIITKNGRPRCKATDHRSGIATCTLTRTNNGTVLIAKATDKAGNRTARRQPLR